MSIQAQRTVIPQAELASRSRIHAGILFGILTVVMTAASGALHADPEIAHATESIKIVSQKVPKAYFYINQELRVEQARDNLIVGLKELDKNISVLAAKVEDDDSKNILLFLDFARDELVTILGQPYSLENGSLVLDYSETMLEGAESILRKYTAAEEEQEMTILLEEMEFLLERISKLYIAYRGGFADYNNVKQLTIAVSAFQLGVDKIFSFADYPAEVSPDVVKLERYWPIAKRFYLGIEKAELPVMVFVSTDHMEQILRSLSEFHSAN